MAASLDAPLNDLAAHRLCGKRCGKSRRRQCVEIASAGSQNDAGTVPRNSPTMATRSRRRRNTSRQVGPAPLPTRHARRPHRHRRRSGRAGVQEPARFPYPARAVLRRHFKPAVRRAPPATEHGLRFHDLRHLRESLACRRSSPEAHLSSRSGTHRYRSRSIATGVCSRPSTRRWPRSWMLVGEDLLDGHGFLSLRGETRRR
jgi:hypothetical protein